MPIEWKPCQTPVALVVFNRPQQTRAVFDRIAQARPTQLLIIADGPRSERQGEAELCEQVRAIATAVTWPCEVRTNFAPENLGCRRRLVSGLNWLFEQVEEAIILEDDVIVDQSFFPFCEEMLARFRTDDRVSMISAFNIADDLTQDGPSYLFSTLTHIWGWATWRRAWARYDETLLLWPEIKTSGLMEQRFADPRSRAYWTTVFDAMHNGNGPNTWDHQWAYTNFMNNTLAVVPGINLMENIGFGPDATHTLDTEDAPALKAGRIRFPLVHPPAMVPMRLFDEVDNKRSGFQIPTFTERLVKRLQRVATRLRKQKPTK
jgi:hypothetical protein